MIIGVVQVSFQIPDALTLKDKRSVMNSLKSRLKNTFNVSVAETDDLENPGVGTLGMACVANEKRFVHEVMSKLVSYVEGDRRIVVLDVQTEVMP